MHDIGLLHLDLKPANIFITGFDAASPASCEVRLGDMGLSLKVKDINAASPVPEVFGTLPFQSPEMSNKLVSAKSDFFAAGLIFCLILSGDMDLYSRHRNTPASQVAQLFLDAVRKAFQARARFSPNKLDTLMHHLSDLCKVNPSGRTGRVSSIQSWITLTELFGECEQD